MVRFLDARSLGILLLALTACASAKPRGQVLRLQNEPAHDEKAAHGTLPPETNYSVSKGKGNVINVPPNPEDAAVFHFSLGQAYSLDNDPQHAIESYRATLVHDPKSALVRARLAAELVKVGNFAEAKTFCEEAIRIDPKYVDSYLLLAGIQVAAKEYEGAIDTYERALRVDGRNRDALLYLGVTLAEVGRVKEGTAQLEKLVKIKDSADSNIDQSVAYYYLAKIYDQANQRDKAIKSYQTALKRRPGFAKAAIALADVYMAKKDVKKAYHVMEEAFAESRSSDIAERLAERHLEQNDYKGAVIYLEALVEEDPANENMKLRLALVYWQIQWLDKAQALLMDLHTRYPSSSEISFYLGELCSEKGEFSLALEYYRVVSPDYAKFDQMVSRVAYAYRQQKQLGEAEEFLLDSMKKRPDIVAFYPLLAAIYEDQRKLDEARVVLEKGEHLFPNDENILYYLGFTLDRLGKKEKALAKMERLLTLNPDSPNALNFVGYSLLEMGQRLEEAKTYLERAVGLKPDDAFILDSYGWFLFRTGKGQEAMKRLEKAFAAKPEEGVIAEHLADIYVSLNLPRKALAVYEHALKSGGDQEFVARVQAKLANVREVLAAVPGTAPASSGTAEEELGESARDPASAH